MTTENFMKFTTVLQYYFQNPLNFIIKVISMRFRHSTQWDQDKRLIQQHFHFQTILPLNLI